MPYRKQTYQHGKEIKGSYGDGKAKINSECLRKVIGRINNTGSLLIIISQTRANIDPVSFANKTRSGGKALGFYSRHEIWLAKKSPINKTVKKKVRDMGVNVVAKISKNKSTGRQGKMEFLPIYHSYGIDDISSCIEYLLSEFVWKKSGNTIVTDKFGFDGTQKALREWIDADKVKQKELISLCESTWKAVNDASSMGWKSKYE